MLPTLCRTPPPPTVVRKWRPLTATVHSSTCVMAVVARLSCLKVLQRKQVQDELMNMQAGLQLVQLRISGHVRHRIECWHYFTVFHRLAECSSDIQDMFAQVYRPCCRLVRGTGAAAATFYQGGHQGCVGWMGRRSPGLSGPCQTLTSSWQTPPGWELSLDSCYHGVKNEPPCQHCSHPESAQGFSLICRS